MTNITMHCYIKEQEKRPLTHYSERLKKIKNTVWKATLSDC